jgi:modification methylase
VVWIKTNPMPNFRGVRFTNAHETLIWASRDKGGSYTFNHHAMKGLNDDKQMRSDWWLLSLATGSERLRDERGDKAHSTQKPEALLYRVILSASDPGDVILDPFLGSGTTAAVARRLHRRWIGIEREARYIPIARQRIAAVEPQPFDEQVFEVRSPRRRQPRVPFSLLVEYGYLTPGQRLFFRRDEDRSARVKPNAKLLTCDGFEGSIHQAGSHFAGGSPCNGWDHWYFETGDEEDGAMQALDVLRGRFRRQHPEALAG